MIDRLKHWHRQVGTTLIVLSVTTAALTVFCTLFPEAPFTLMLIPMVLGSQFLGPRVLPWFVIYALGGLTLAVWLTPDLSLRIAFSVAVIFVLGLIILITSFRRSILGVAGTMGESMLVDLRERIHRQGTVPNLPEGWRLEHEMRSASGSPFAGDFVVTGKSPGGRLEIVVVDVSGKGNTVGTRALLLSGAFGGLLGALDPARFLEAANDYLLRQGWDEGFATAVHASIDLATGEYAVRSAGHPAPAHRHAGSGRWSMVEADGPLLGILDGVEFPEVTGVLSPGDTVLFYTDGMIEERDLDLEIGQDRMLGRAEQILRGDWSAGAAGKLVEQLGGRGDDRALVVLHRN